MTNGRRLLILLVAVALVLGVTTPGRPAAAEVRTVYVARDGATVYDIGGRAIGAAGVNTPLALTGMRGDICQVVSNGHTGYMYRADLSASQIAQTASVQATAVQTAYAAVNGARVYNIQGRVLGTVPANTEVGVTAVRGNVCQVTRDGKTAYMLKSELSANPVETAAAPEQTAGQVCATAYANKDGARVYNLSGAVLGAVPLNTEVTVTATRGGVCRVTRGGGTAYMRAEDLSCEKTTVAAAPSVTAINPMTGYASVDGAKVYDASGSVLGTLRLNTAVTVDAMNDTLCRVVSGANVGYMLRSELSTAQTVAAGYVLKFGDSGEAVMRVQARLKELGYFNGTIGGNYQAQTQAAVTAFQTQAKLTANGVADAATLQAMFASNAPSAPVTAVITPSADGNSTVTPASGTARAMDWWTSGIQSIFPRGATAIITDVATGLAWREQRKGGTNHADVQPLTAADTAVLKRVYGGKWSWDRRAIFVTINGVNYAASMNGMPHGAGSISGNNFNGHHCIHFTNSRTHGSNKVCSLHQAAIQRALAARL